MLNRRILRVKAFQNLYAYEQSKASNFNLAKDQIREAFLPDLNSMEVQDKVQLKKDAELAIKLFSSNLNSKNLISETDVSTKIKSESIKAINYYHKANKADHDFLLNNMVISAERIPQLYLYAIQLLIAFGDHVAKEIDRKRKISNDAIISTLGDLNLANNAILKKIKTMPEYQSAVIRQDAQIDELELEIKEWFREYVKPSEGYQEYIKINAPTLTQDYEILDDILKKIIFKNNAILNFFSEKDLNWTENKSVVRSLASKVLKNLSTDPSAEEALLPEIAINWEEDKEFFQNIFNLTIECGDEHMELIGNKTKNWDIERVAYTDKIIMSMALTEMKKFPSIPVKVSINEYIDISKTYSTPKSKQFVNGLLDVLAKELTESGEIRKSGRGLLDNK
ncbi:antitermination protein [Rhodonellum psychrophilum GCM71 = DSM 17998]|jgi:N utilization substance protein B|uniref:Antitermination protein n=2 Tax=Rhodonellum TaxID=336827 RepID=U5BY73_9BACT|nr:MULTISPECIES: transcription antitermination factor NusB [Rhodonellum]ERM82524.1 antitermination protein [Rhodonellum psychrophilum GCM71 = DSM 17998]MDO9552307.1 transcription antitermination factor NusB [Rhodonellum sp.]SDY54687.1 NusB antitermination factor [Rhodonellum ikkaensis]